MRIKQKITWFILSVLSILCFQNCQGPAKYLISKGFLDCKYIGFNSQLSKSYKKYEKLRNNSSYKQLTEYSQSHDIVLRAYAHWAILERFENQFINIFEHALMDTSKILVRCGDTNRPRTVASYSYIRYIEGKNIEYELDMEYPIYKESLDIRNQIAKMDSLIMIYMPEDKYAIELALFNREYYSEPILKNIIHLAFDKDIESAGRYIKRHWNKESFKNYKRVVRDLDKSNLSSTGKKLLNEVIKM